MFLPRDFNNSFLFNRSNELLAQLDSSSKKLFSILHPEITSDPNHEMAFDYALAVTSNGEAVLKNAGHALRAYRGWRETGKFEIRGYGKRREAMEKSFKFFNIMKDELK